MARDRTGIVRDVSAGLASIGGNITHVSQTVMRGYFTLILSVQAPDERTHAEICQVVERNGGLGEFGVNVRQFVEVPEAEMPAVERFTLSMRGEDKQGLIAAATTYLADKGINIEDVYAYVQAGSALILAQVAVPVEMDSEGVQAGLEEALKDFRVETHLQHENIFRATNEVLPVLGLQRVQP